MRTIFLCDSGSVPLVWKEREISELKEKFGLDGKIYGSSDLNGTDFQDVDFIFSTWGMPSLSEEKIGSVFGSLKAVFYGAGSVQAFARAFLARGVRVFSAWQANAVPVVEFAVSQIVLANKGYFASCGVKSKERLQALRAASHGYPGNYGAKVGILGAGQIGSRVIERLKRDYKLDVYVFDPFLPDEKAAKLGAVKTDLKTIFSSCVTISNHLANNPQTVGIITADLLASMPERCTFINTGRGAQVDHAALYEAMKARPESTALLDVTWPEPLDDGDPLYSLPNVIITPHIAGSQEAECERMAEYMLDEAKRFTAGEPLLYEVTEEMLKTMA